MTALERRYRRLLRLFPRGYREHRGEEILGTLLDAVPPGRRRPPVRDVADLLRAAAVAWFRALTGPAGRASLRDGVTLGAAGAAVLSGAVNPLTAVVAAGGLAGNRGLAAVAASAVGLLPGLWGGTGGAGVPAAAMYTACSLVVVAVGLGLRRRCAPTGPSAWWWMLAAVGAFVLREVGFGDDLLLVAVLLGSAVAGLVRRPAYAVAAAVVSVGLAAWAWGTVWDRATYGYTTTVGNRDVAAAVGVVAVVWLLAAVALVRQSSRAYVRSTRPGTGSQSDSGVRAKPSRS